MAASVPHAESSSRLECFESQLAELEVIARSYPELLLTIKLPQRR